ncbi:MAG: DUF4384 domain-containing protein [Spirochaetaceae bacterium]|jgi:hypothetical protein|nr:DUF4384 domain-containing protein [Spirochaetaceae bacterium]
MNRCFLLPILLSCFPLFSQDTGLSWTMALDRSAGGVRTFSRPILMTDGETFILVIRATEACYCYIVYQDAVRNTEILYNGRLTAGNDLSLGPYRLEPPSGTETIQVVISKIPQQKIDDAAKNYAQARSRGNADKLMNSIYELRRSISSLVESPEKPVLLGGAFRDTGGGTTGVQYTGTAVYVKSVLIRH